MANSSLSPTSEQAINSNQELARALERELQKNRRARTPEAANGAGSSLTSSSMNVPTPLLKLLVECCSLNSPRNRGSISRGLSSAPSVSSDSSVSCGLNSTTMERSNRMSVSYHRSAPVAQEGPNPTPNSPMPLSAPNAGRGKIEIPPSTTVGKRAAASTAIARGGRGIVKVPKKRKRQSKKPLTTIVQASVMDFRTTVQKLTGCKDLPLPVILPQPPPQPERRLQANALPIGVDLDGCHQPASPESPLTSMTVQVRSPAPTGTSDRAPPATFAVYDSDASVPSVPSLSKSRSLNHWLGYDEEATPHFLSAKNEDYDEKLGQLQEDCKHHLAPDAVDRHPSEPKHAYSTTAPASSSRASFLKAGSLDLNSESQTKESNPGEQIRCSQSGGNHDISSASNLSLQFMHQHHVFGLSIRHEELSGAEMGLELEQDWPFYGGYADSLLGW